MKIKVLYFAQLRDAAKTDEEFVDAEHPISVGECVKKLLDRPAFLKYREWPFRYAMNDAFVEPDRLIEDGATLAVLPPVAGG